MKKLSLLIIALSAVAVFVGATLKLNGNPNSSIVLNIGFFSTVAGVLLLYQDFSDLRDFLDGSY